MKKMLALALLLALLLSACVTADGAGPAAGPDPVGEAPATAAGAPKLSEDGRIILTIGAFQKDSGVNALGDLASYTYLTRAAERFNETNRDYLVEIRSYGDAADADALERLDSEVLGGKLPDMLAAWGMPVERYARQGLLLDLYEWYDRDAFFAGPLKSMETEGRLFSVSSSVQIVSFYGLESVLGRAESYGLEDLAGAWECFYTGENAFIPQLGSVYAFLLLAGMRSGEWVDRSAGVCRYDSPEFLSLLEFCRKLPGEAALTRTEASARDKLPYDQLNALCVKEHDALLGLMLIDDGGGSILGEYAEILTQLDGEPIVYIGIPGADSAAAGCISELPVAVSAACRFPDGAKQFLDSLWDLKYRQYHEGEMRSIPLMRPVLEEHIRFYEEHSGRTLTDENGETRSVLHVGGTIRPLLDADVRDLLALIESASIPVPPDVMSRADPVLQEEALACFGGSQSAEKTAKNIQTRCSAYLDEQKKA